VDPAETFEQAAAREVTEEVGLAVTDLTYYGSEAWGLSGPDVLLAVFTARSVDPTAEPVVDGHALAESRFFPIDALPDGVPPAHLIAARVLADLPDPDLRPTWAGGSNVQQTAEVTRGRRSVAQHAVANPQGHPGRARGS
jgi:NAD+ diphosphatase